MKLLFLVVFLCVSLNANIKEKTPSDVYSVVLGLKQKVILLRKEAGITTEFPQVQTQSNKKPRHVIQKSLEVLTKINKYRRIKGFGEIAIPLYPSREITPSDVYYMVVRLNKEVSILISDKDLINNNHSFFVNKTPNDVYKELWTVSLGLDDLLGRGFTPTDVYEQSEKIVKIVKYLRASQGGATKKTKPQIKNEQHPNHALYASIALMDKISAVQKKLWMSPMEVPVPPQRVITPTEVYDSLQIVIAELQRIKRRIGVERYFDIEEVTVEKRPADVVQNLEYAATIFPEFSLESDLKQFDSASLNKNPNDIYALTEIILKKILYLKEFKGIRIQPLKQPNMYGLKSIHTYEKAIENLEKINRIKVEHGLLTSSVPLPPSKNVTSNKIYEIVYRLDSEIDILLHNQGVTDIKSWKSDLNKAVYDDKTSTDVYNNLWKISSLFDVILGGQYTPNETFVLAKKIEYQIDLISIHLTKKIHGSSQNEANKFPNDVFNLSVEVYNILNKVQKRANLPRCSNIVIPKDNVVTPTTVYNALRVINATVNELRIHFKIEQEEYDFNIDKKTPSDVYNILNNIKEKLLFLLKDNNYEI